MARKRTKHDFTGKAIIDGKAGVFTLVATNGTGAKHTRTTSIPANGNKREAAILAECYAEELNRKYCLPSGMIIRGTTYYARFKLHGQAIRQRLSKDFNVACQMLEELRQRAERGEMGQLDNDYPWDKLKAEFLKWCRQSIRCHAKYESDLNVFERFRKVKSVREITPEYVFSFREWRLSGGGCPKNRPVASPRTINRQVAILQSMLNKAAENRTIGSNPIVSVKPLRHDTPTKERRSLTVEEAEQLLKVLPEHLKCMILIYLSTGMRRNELVSLKFTDVDFCRRVARIQARNSKTGKAREVILDDESLKIIERLQEQAAGREPLPSTPAGKFTRDHVFVTKLNTPRKHNLLREFYRYAQKAGIDDAKPGGSIDIHALRGSFVTLAIEGGANPKAVQKIVGHANIAMTMDVYAKATDKGMRGAVNSLPFAKASTPDVIPFERPEVPNQGPSSKPSPEVHTA